jgi:hypothetical protein
MAKKHRKPATKKQSKPAAEIKTISVLGTLLDEIAEAVELMRPHFPTDDDDALRHRAMALRAKRYRVRHWPDFEQLGKAEAAEAAAMATAEVKAATEAAAVFGVATSIKE